MNTDHLIELHGAIVDPDGHVYIRVDELRRLIGELENTTDVAHRLGVAPVTIHQRRQRGTMTEEPITERRGPLWHPAQFAEVVVSDAASEHNDGPPQERAHS